MVRLKYVGIKERSEAFKALTGIVWLNGAEHEVKDEHAALMLKHPDVFALADEHPDAGPVSGLEDAAPVAQESAAEPVKRKPGRPAKAKG